MVSKVMGSEMVCCSSILAAEVATAQTLECANRF